MSNDLEQLRAENEELRRANAELRSRQAVEGSANDRNLLATIVESSHDPIISKDLNGTITSWNRAAEELFGYTAEEAVGHNVKMLFPPDKLHEEVGIVDAVVRGEKVEMLETVRLRKDGQPVYVSLTVSAVKDASGRVVGASKILHDLTSRRRAQTALLRTEQQLRQAQKMEAVGQLAGGVAHDFNNMLSVILSYAEMMLGALTPGDPMRDEVEEIRKAGERAADLTRQLLAFSRQQVLQPRVIDLNVVLSAWSGCCGDCLVPTSRSTLLRLGRLRAFTRIKANSSRWS